MEDLSQPLSPNISNEEVAHANCGTHLKVLLWKQYLTHKRNWKGVLCIALSPFVLCLFLLLMQFVADTQVAVSVREPEVYTMGGIPKCIPPAGSSTCVSVGFGILVNYLFPKYISNRVKLEPLGSTQLCIMSLSTQG